MGNMWYLTHTKLYLMFYVEYLSRYIKNPIAKHMKAAKRVLKYVKGTINLGLKCERRTLKLIGYNGNDYARYLSEKKNIITKLAFLWSRVCCQHNYHLPWHMAVQVDWWIIEHLIDTHKVVGWQQIKNNIV